MIENVQVVNAFFCERVIQDATDGVPSVIRLVDVFLLPEDRPADQAIGFFMFVTVKFKVGFIPGKTPFTFTLIRSNGEREKIAEQTADPPQKQVPGPSGIGVVLQVGIIPRNMGTAYIEVAIDGDIIATVPFTLVPLSQQPVQK